MKHTPELTFTSLFCSTNSLSLLINSGFVLLFTFHFSLILLLRHLIRSERSSSSKFLSHTINRIWPNFTSLIID